MKAWLRFFLVFVALFSIYGILTFQPEYVVFLALVLIITIVTIAADLIERYFPKSKIGRFIRKIEEFLFDYA